MKYILQNNLVKSVSNLRYAGAYHIKPAEGRALEFLVLGYVDIGRNRPPSTVHKGRNISRSAKNMHPLDAASPNSQYKPYIRGSGNKEQIGFVDQVGGQSFSADFFEFGGGTQLHEGIDKGGVQEPMNPAILARTREFSSRRGQHAIGPAVASPTKETSERTAGKIFVARDQRVPGMDEDDSSGSGVWSHSGEPGTEDSRLYSTVSKKDPYDPPRASRDEKLRYGGRKWKVNSKPDDV